MPSAKFPVASACERIGVPTANQPWALRPKAPGCPGQSLRALVPRVAQLEGSSPRSERTADDVRRPEHPDPRFLIDDGARRGDRQPVLPRASEDFGAFQKRLRPKHVACCAYRVPGSRQPPGLRSAA